MWNTLLIKFSKIQHVKTSCFCSVFFSDYRETETDKWCKRHVEKLRLAKFRSKINSKHKF